MGELEERPLVGNIQDYPIRWISFELDDKGHLFIRTLYGLKVIEDPKKARKILDTLKQISEIEVSE